MPPASRHRRQFRHLFCNFRKRAEVPVLSICTERETYLVMQVLAAAIESRNPRLRGRLAHQLIVFVTVSFPRSSASLSPTLRKNQSRPASTVSLSSAPWSLKTLDPFGR